VATTVQIFLPYVQAQLSATSPMTATGNGEGQESILLVEDNPEVREITTKLLTEFGYTLRPFATGPEAVAYARQHPSTFDLLITDIMMPQMNGHAVANAILAIRPTLPILLISGYAEEQPDALVHRTHVGFLAKPYSATALTSKVRALLHQR
jgi:CheY-like chemotaxis protein